MFAKWLTIRIRPNAIHKEYCANPKTMTMKVMIFLTRLEHPLVSKCTKGSEDSNHHKLIMLKIKENPINEYI